MSYDRQVGEKERLISRSQAVTCFGLIALSYSPVGVRDSMRLFDAPPRGVAGHAHCERSDT